MNLLFRIVVTSILVMVISYFFPSIAHVDGLNSAIIVAIVLGLLNVFGNIPRSNVFYAFRKRMK